MKRNMILYALACVLTVSCLAVLISQGKEAERLPVPVEVKPVLVEAAKVWTIRNDTGVHLIAYYQRVKMPDGTTQELKSRTALTAEEWQTLAQKQWDAQLAAELSKPKFCTRCGGSGIEP